MNPRKQLIYKRRPATFGVLVVSAVLLAVGIGNPAPAQAHHAAECGDVFTPLSSYVTDGVAANRGAYERAQNETGVPWELLAAIHYRETNFRHYNPSNGQGVFQFANGAGGPYPPGEISSEEFYRQLKFMADRIQDDYAWRGSAPRERRRLVPNEPNAAIVKDTLFSYNGRAGEYINQAQHFGFNKDLQPYEGSPYVMNRFDCPRARMGIITQDYGSLDGQDTRYGAFTVYARLKGDGYWQSLWSSPFAAFGDAFVVARSQNSSDLRQWVIHDNVKQLIPSPEIIVAWGLQDTPATTFSTSILNSLPAGPTLGRLMRDRNRSTQYLVDDGKRYAITSTQMLDAWNLRGTTMSEVSSGLANVPADGGKLTYAVRKQGTGGIYRVSGVSGGNVVLNVYPSPEMFMAWEGDSPRHTVVSADLFNSLDNAVGSPVTSVKINYGGAQYMVNNGKRLGLTAAVAKLYPGGGQDIIAHTFKRLPYNGAASPFIRINGTNGVFLVDDGQKHTFTDPYVLQAWAPNNTPLVNVVNASYANFLPTTGRMVSEYTVKSGSGQMYLLDGRKLPIPGHLATPYGGSDVLTVGSNLLDTLATGPEASLFIKAEGKATISLLENGVRRPFTNPADFSAWTNGGNYFIEVSPTVAESFPRGAVMDAYVTSGGTNYLIDSNTRHATSSAVASAMGLPAPAAVSSSTLDRMPSGTAFTAPKFKVGSTFYMANNGNAWQTNNADLAALWQLSSAPTASDSLMQQVPNRGNLSRFIRSTNADDKRIFTIDNGKIFPLASPQMVWNLGYRGAPLMPVTSTEISNRLQGETWRLPLLKNQEGGYYVVDSGLKRPFANIEAHNQWTNNGQLAAPTVSSSTFNLLASGGLIGKSIKGSNNTIYSVTNGQKRWVMSPSTYSRQFAPFSQTSDLVIETLPNGPNVP